MALYSGCNLLVTVPVDYSEKNELIRFLESKFEGCKIGIEEFVTSEPYVDTASVAKGAQLSGLQVSKEWVPLGQPAPTESISGEFLLRSATEAIQEFIGSKEILKSASAKLRQKVNEILDKDPSISLKDALIRLCSSEPKCFGEETAEVQDRLRRLKILAW